MSLGSSGDAGGCPSLAGADTGLEMAKGNADRFFEAAEAFNRRDLEAWLAAFDEECVFESRVAPIEGAARGHDGVAAFLRNIEDTFEVFEVDFDDVRDLGDRVLALGSVRNIGKGSGLEMSGPLAIIARFQGGRITHFKDFDDRERALEAAGLSE
jgi:ketosteroid isomerase-like protein